MCVLLIIKCHTPFFFIIIILNSKRYFLQNTCALVENESLKDIYVLYISRNAVKSMKTQTSTLLMCKYQEMSLIRDLTFGHSILVLRVLCSQILTQLSH